MTGTATMYRNASLLYCRNWDYNCKVDDVTVVLTSLTSALLIITLAVYFAMLFFAQRQLAKKPYFAYRVGNILLHVQLQVGGWDWYRVN